MQTFQRLVDEANKAFQTADHLASSTYPLVRDAKLLLVITENMFKALTKGMEAVLHYEKMYKRIPPLNNDFSSQFYAFKEKCVPRYGFSREGVMVLQDIKGILDHQKNSPIEFRRGADRFIMADHDFRMQSLDITKVKNYLKITKEFVFKVNGVYNKAIATHARGM
ncbi:MAG TPA: hypothetical protein VJB87_05125 [Candidatus Nanoarchaeia archaeon]|nr:hypothetical protein [Candidatus Nanoarchaeia archaeon]